MCWFWSLTLWRVSMFTTATSCTITNVPVTDLWCLVTKLLNFSQFSQWVRAPLQLTTQFRRVQETRICWRGRIKRWRLVCKRLLSSHSFYTLHSPTACACCVCVCVWYPYANDRHCRHSVPVSVFCLICVSCVVPFNTTVLANCISLSISDILTVAAADWCCFYYFVRNSLVALLEALCARIISFRFVNIGFVSDFFFLCVCVCKAASLNQAPVPGCLHSSCVLIVHVCLCVCASVCACQNV